MSTTNPVANAGGTPGADDHDRAGPPAPEVIARGYEADGYDTASVIGVPILVLAFFVLAFGTTTVLFRFLRERPHDPLEHPVAAQRNAEPLNDRMSRIHRGADVTKGGVDQPRLEPLKLRDSSRADSRAMTRPELPYGNSPELHPEDLIPSRATTPELFRTGGTRMPLDEAMKALLARNALPTQKTGMMPEDSSSVPSAANAGRGPSPKPAGKDGKKAGGH